VVGDGFGIPLLLRYALQLCNTTAEAVAVLCRVPCHMAYTVTVLDAHAHHATVFLSPDRAPSVTPALAATNHQGFVEWPQHALSTGSVARLSVVAAAAADPRTTADGFVKRFLDAPVWSNRHAASAGTLYAASYTPTRRTLTMLWPGTRWEQGIEGFDEGSRTVSLVR
jgi:predicted choloylglycine hydrolase